MPDMEETTVQLKYRGDTRLLVLDKIPGCLQLNIIKRDQVLDIFRAYTPVDERAGLTIKGLRKNDPAANQQEIVAEITTSASGDDVEILEKFFADSKEFIKKVEKMEFIVLILPPLMITVVYILID